MEKTKVTKRKTKKKSVVKGIVELFHGKYFFKTLEDVSFEDNLKRGITNKVEEETREVIKAIIKYKRFPTETNKKELRTELIDLIQAAYSIITILFEEDEIKKGLKAHDEKIKQRMIRKYGKVPAE